MALIFKHLGICRHIACHNFFSIFNVLFARFIIKAPKIFHTIEAK